MAQWCNPLTLKPEQSGGVGSIPELQKVSEPRNQVPRKFSSLAENFSGKVCSDKEKMIVFSQFLKKKKTYFIFLH